MRFFYHQFQRHDDGEPTPAWAMRISQDRIFHLQPTHPSWAKLAGFATWFSREITCEQFHIVFKRGKHHRISQGIHTDLQRIESSYRQWTSSDRYLDALLDLLREERIMNGGGPHVNMVFYDYFVDDDVGLNYLAKYLPEASVPLGNRLAEFSANRNDVDDEETSKVLDRVSDAFWKHDGHERYATRIERMLANVERDRDLFDALAAICTAGITDEEANDSATLRRDKQIRDLLWGVITPLDNVIGTICDTLVEAHPWLALRACERAVIDDDFVAVVDEFLRRQIHTDKRGLVRLLREFRVGKLP